MAKTKAKTGIIINEDLCKGCTLCVGACPKDCIEMATDHINIKGIAPAVFVHPENCTGCRNCSVICPDVAISVFKEE